MIEEIFTRLKTTKGFLFLFLFYAGASQLAQTLLYTIVAYLVAATNKSGTEFGNTVNEIAVQYQFFTYSLAAISTAFILWKADQSLYRSDFFWNEPHKPFWQLSRASKMELVRGLSSGLIALIVYLSLFLISGKGTFLGVYITSTLGTPAFPLFFLNFICLGSLLLLEEYLVRHKWLLALGNTYRPLTTVIIISLASTTIKSIQFELTSLDLVNIFILNLLLTFYTLRSQKCHRGIGFLLSLVWLIHCFAGLPLWENESPSFFIFKSLDRQHELLFGGANGPFAGLALFTVLVVFFVASFLNWEAAQPEKKIQRKS